MKNKKGFTLIELLAVIVILAIVALIATPIILNVINDARKGAFKRSAEGVLKSAKLSYTSSIIKDPSVTDVIYYCDGNNCLANDKQLEVSGSVGIGDVYVYADGTIAFTLTNESYCAAKYIESDKIIITEGNCDAIDISNDTTPPVINDLGTTATSTTNTITVAVSASENESSIKGYNYKLVKGETVIEDYADKLSGNAHIFRDLDSNTEYKVYIRAYNREPSKPNYDETKNMSEKVITIKTKLLPTPVIEVENFTTWTQSKKVNIYYNGNDASIDMTGITSSYTIEKDGVELSSGTENEITVTDNVIIKAVNIDSSNNKLITTTIIDTIDISAADIIRVNKVATSKNIILTTTATDEQSGVANVKCYYGENYANEVVATPGNDNGYTCTFSNDLAPGTEYNYKVVVTNGAGMTTEQEGTSTTSTLGSISATFNPGENEWSDSKTVTLSGATGGARLQYTLGDSVEFIDYTAPFVIVENTNLNVRLYDDVNASNVTTYVIDTIYIPASSVTYGNTNVQAAIEDLYEIYKNL